MVKKKTPEKETSREQKEVRQELLDEIRDWESRTKEDLRKELLNLVYILIFGLFSVLALFLVAITQTRIESLPFVIIGCFIYLCFLLSLWFAVWCHHQRKELGKPPHKMKKDFFVKKEQ